MENSETPAAPCDHKHMDSYGQKFQHMYTGLTKREYFAGLAMQGLLSCDEDNELTCEDIAITSRQLADALLKELDK